MLPRINTECETGRQLLNQVQGLILYYVPRILVVWLYVRYYSFETELPELFLPEQRIGLLSKSERNQN